MRDSLGDGSIAIVVENVAFVPSVEAKSSTIALDWALGVVKAIVDPESATNVSMRDCSLGDVEESVPGIEFFPVDTMDKGKVLSIHDSLLVKTVAQFSNSLVGIFYGNSSNIDSIRKWVIQIWKLRGQVEVVSMLNNFFLFSFSSLEDCSRVLHEVPWFMGLNGLCLKVCL